MSLETTLILALVILGAGMALILRKVCARPGDKRKIAPDEKIEEGQHLAPSVVKCEASPESQEPVSVRPQNEVPSVEAKNKPADSTDANRFHPEKVESALAVVITRPEAEPMTSELAKFHEEEFHPENKNESGAEVTAVEMEEAAEGMENRKPTRAAEGTGVGMSEPPTAGVDESSRTKETEPHQERVAVKPEERGGRSRETMPKNQVESKKKRRARTPKPEIVCWKREHEWILAVELPEDFSENQNVSVVQDGKPLDEDDTEDSCWRLSQLHGEVVVRVFNAENESLFKLPIGDVGCLVFKLSGGDRNRGRHVKRPGSGSCLVVVPKDWKRDEALAGAPPYEPEEVCLLGYRAHFFEL